MSPTAPTAAWATLATSSLALPAVRAQGVAPIVEAIRRVAPWLGDRLDGLTDVNQLALLPVRITSVDRWSEPGLLLIGDAAHVISPVGGNGINYALADAAETEEPRAQEELPFVFFRDDRSTTMSGSSGDVERARRHRRANERLLWFRYGGQEYVVRDAGVLRQVEELWDAVSRIGEEQGRIGQRQGAIGEEQGRIGVQQGEIGARQARIGARQAAVGARLPELADAHDLLLRGRRRILHLERRRGRLTLPRAGGRAGPRRARPAIFLIVASVKSLQSVNQFAYNAPNSKVLQMNGGGSPVARVSAASTVSLRRNESGYTRKEVEEWPVR